MAIIEISDFYKQFLRNLSNKSKTIAPLNLTGRLEDYLVLEFISHVYRESGGKILGIRNLGNTRDELKQKYDIAFIKSNSNGEREIICAVEAKYLTNAHKLRKQEDATDNIKSTIESLSDQLSRNVAASHGDYPVNPEAIGAKVYGLVLASRRKAHPWKEGEKDLRFYDKILEMAEKMELTNYNSNKKRPSFDEVYNDIEVTVLGQTYYLTLKAGLWQNSVSK